MNYFILDKYLKTVAIAQTDSSSRNAFHVLEDMFVEYSNAPSTLELTLDFYNEKALEVKEGAHVVFEYESAYRLFQIKQVEEQHASDSYVKIYAEESSFELLDAVVFARDYVSPSAEYLLDIALADTDWEVGEVSPVSLEQYSFNAYATALNQVQQIATDTGCMLTFRVNFTPQKGVTGKYVDLLEKVTIDEGKRLEFGRNVDSINRTVDRTTVCTAVIPVGSNDTLISGFDWVNVYDDKTIIKNKDLYYLSVDETTRSEINPNSDHHLFHVLQEDTEDKSTLCQRAYEYLTEHKEPHYTYDVAAILFNNDNYKIGEQVRIIDDELGVSMVADVSEKTISFCNPDRNSMTLTNYEEKASNISQALYNIQNKLQTSVLNNPLIIVSPDEPSTDSDNAIWIDTSGASTGEVILNQYFNGTWIPTLNSGTVGDVIDGKLDEKIEESEKSLQIYIDEKTEGIRILKGTTPPSTAIEGQLFINSENGDFYQYLNGQWIQITDMDSIDNAIGNIQQLQAELQAVAGELQGKANELQAKTNELETKANELIITAGELATATNNMETRLIEAEGKIALTATKTEVKAMIDGITIGGGNLILNSNFSKGHTNWSEVGEIDTEICVDECSAKITGVANSNLGKSQTLDGIKPNVTYTFTGWYKTENLVNNGYVAYHISYYDSSSTWIGEVCLANIPSGTKDWTKVTHTFTTPENLSSATLILYVRNSTGIVWFDQMQLEEGNMPTAWTPNSKDIAEDISDLDVRVTQNTANLQVANDKIASKVDSTTYQTDKANMQANISQNASAIEQNAQQIQLRVTETQMSTALDNIKIGGRNYFLNTRDMTCLRNYAGTGGTWSNVQYVESEETPSGKYVSIDYNMPDATRQFGVFILNTESISITQLEVGKEYTYSMYINPTKDVVWHAFDYEGGTASQELIYSSHYNGAIIPANTWTRLVRVIRIIDGTRNFNCYVKNIVGDVSLRLTSPKLEEGNKVTSWTPAPEDVQEDMNALGTRISTAETSITQNANQIALRATKTEMKQAIDDIEIGGRNLITKASVTAGTWINPDGTTTPYSNCFVTDYITVNPNQDYVGQVVFYSPTNMRICEYDANKVFVKQTDTAEGYVIHLTTASNTKYVRIGFKGNGTSLDNIKGVMFEKGNKPSAYQPAPEDLESRVSSAETSIIQNAEQIQLRATKTEVTDAINNIDIGGTNLFKGYKRDEEIRLNDYQGVGGFTQLSNRLIFDPSTTVGETYTVSFMAKSPNGITPINVYNSNGNPRYFFFSRYQLDAALGTEWKHLSYTFTNQDMGANHVTTPSIVNRIEIYAPNQLGVLVKNIKVEKGSKATDWSVCPADVDALTNRIANAETSITQNANEIALRATKTEMSNAIKDIEIGGRNLLLDSKKTVENSNYGLVTYNYSDTSLMVNGETYTLSFDGMLTNAAQTGFYVNTYPSPHAQCTSVSAKAKDGKYYRYTATFNLPANGGNGYTALGIYSMPLDGAKYTAGIKNVKLEKGSYATDWTPAPEDMETRITKAETSITQNSEQIQLKASKTEMDTAIGNIKLGGANILRNSKPNVTNNGYPTAIFNLTDNSLKDGDTVTISIKGSLGSGKQRFSIYNSGGSVDMAHIYPSDKGSDGVYRKTFNWKTSVTVSGTTYTANNTNIQVYPMPSTDTSNSTIEWIMLEKGNKPSQSWSPAPEDVAAEYSGLATRISSAETSITQNANEIALRATKTELTNSANTLNNNINNAVNGIQVGGRNLLTKANLQATGVTVTDTNYIKSFTKNVEYAGLFIQCNTIPLKMNTKYVLSYKIRKTAGTLSNIGGHTDGTYNVSKATLDGALITYSGSTNANDTLNDGNFHEVVVHFTVSGVNDAKMYIQPNRGVTTSVTVEIKDWQLEEGTHKTQWNPNPDDITTRLSNAETSITTNANEIALRATKTEMTTNISNAVNNIKLGGTNLFKESGRWTALPSTNGWISNGGGITLDTSTKYLGYNTIKTTVGNGIVHNNFAFIEVDPKKTYTYSAMVKCNESYSGAGNLPLHYHCANNSTDSGNTAGVTTIAYDQSVVANQWKLIYLTFQPKGSWFRAFFYIGSGTRTFNIAYLKLEEGNKPTDWTPNPDDVTNQINTVNTTLSNRISSNTTAITTNANNINLRATKTEMNTAIKDIQIGGRNLIVNSSLEKSDDNWQYSGWSSHNHDNGYLELYKAESTSRSFYFQNQNHNPLLLPNEGQHYVLSLMVKKISGQAVPTGSSAFMRYVMSDNTYTEINVPIPTDLSETHWTHIYSTMQYKVKSGCTLASVQLTIAGGNPAGAFACKHFMYEAGNKPSAWVDNYNELLMDLETRVANAEIAINPDSIVATVLESTAYATATEDFVGSDDIKDMATKEDVTSGINGIDFAKKIDERVNEQISDPDSPLAKAYVTQAQMTQTKTDIDMQFINAGGINLIRNSLGFNGINDGNWTVGGVNVIPNLGGSTYTTDYIFSSDRTYCTLDNTNNRIAFKGATTLRINTPNLKPKTTYTWSFEVWTTGTDTGITTGNWMRKDDGSGAAASFNAGISHSISTSATKVYHTFTTTANVVGDVLHIGSLNTADTYYFRNFQLEESYIYTDYRKSTAGDDSSYFVTGYDADADLINFDSAITFVKGSGRNKNLAQAFPTIAGETYTVGFYIKKNTTNPFYYAVRNGSAIKTDSITMTNISYGSNGTINTVTNGYQFVSFNFVAPSSIAILKFNAAINDDVALTGIMVNRGDLPLAHTFARGEVYNTNINFDMNGIKVTQLDASGNPIGFTVMSPDEFAGYYDTDGDGSYEKIFYLNQDAVVSKRSVATHEIIMGKLKYINLDDATYKGWALVPSTVNDWAITGGTDA